MFDHTLELSPLSIPSAETPLPLVIAQHFGFLLNHHIMPNGTYFYSISDWLIGVIHKNIWNDLNQEHPQLKDLCRQFERVGSSGNTYWEDCTDQSGLSEITHLLDLNDGIMRYFYERISLLEEKKGSVYIVSIKGMPGYYKIGQTTDLKARVSAINTATPFDVILEYSAEFPDFKILEARFHKLFRHKHIKGEWFYLSEDDVAYIKNTLELYRAFFDITAMRPPSAIYDWMEIICKDRIVRLNFMDSLRKCLKDAPQQAQYRSLIEEMRFHLWQRTGADLKEQIGFAYRIGSERIKFGIDNLREHRSNMALTYESLCEVVCCFDLNQRNNLDFDEVRDILRFHAERISNHAEETGRILGIDIATNRPLLDEGKQG